MSDQELPVETDPEPVVGGGGGIVVPADVEPIETIVDPIVGISGGFDVDMAPIFPTRASGQDDRRAQT